MNTRFVCTLLVALGVSTSAAWAGMLYDGFDYPTSDSLAGQINPGSGAAWAYVGTGAANTAAPTLGSGSLSHPDLPPAVGNSVVTNRSQSGVARIALTDAISSDTVYYSALVRVNDMAGLTNTTTGSFFAGLNTGAGGGTSITTSGAALMIHRDADNASAYNLGVGVSVGNPDRIFDTTELVAGQTVFVVASYTFNPGADDDVAQLWINPPSSTFGALAPPPATVISDGILSAATASDTTGSLMSFFLRNNIVEPQQIQIDELRVHTRWAAVTPEPSSMALMALGVLGLIAGTLRKVKLR